MSPQLIVVDTLEGIKELQVYLLDKNIVAYDCETTGLSKDSKVIGFSICAEEDKAYYVILSKWDSSKNSLVDIDYEGADELTINFLARKKLIMHNGVFD